MLGFLRHNLKISSSSIKEKSYKAFVRPLLEYASSVWDPYKQRSIDKLEAVQRRATRYVLNRYHNTSSVSRLIEQLRWPSLAQWRKTTCLGTIYKIYQGLIQCPIIWSKLVPPHQDSAAPTTNSSASSTPELSTEVDHSYPGLLGTGTIFPVRQ